VTFDPLKGSGNGTTSCWVVAFDPSVAAVTTGNSVASFIGFAGLLAPPALNHVNPGSAEPLNFTFPTPGLNLCSTVNNSGSSCTGGASKPWVAFGTAGGSNLQTFGPTTVGGMTVTSYRFNWKTKKTATLGTCVVMVAQFSSGLAVFPDYFLYAKQ
jgi:hypothetical protein